MRRPALIAALLLGALLGGCGQKGPLYLPDKGGKVATPPPPASGSAPAQSAPGPQDLPAPGTPHKSSGDDATDTPH
jgi:predicted small lipoprotein YifL